eukprot:gene6532-biopygen8934
MLWAKIGCGAGPDGEYSPDGVPDVARAKRVAHKS